MTSTSLGERARALGHEPRVEHVGKRYRIVCSCGWSTRPTNTAKTTFRTIHEHLVRCVIEAGGRMIGEEVDADVPEG